MHIGLFFGSFNPIHTGHLVIAEQVLAHTELQEIWFIVSPQNPLKNKAQLLGEYDRLHLVDLAIEDNLKFRASNIEFSMPKPSYTIDTLTHLSEKYPQHQFAILMGGDNLESLPRWKNYELILDHYRVFVYNRPGTNVQGPLADHKNVTVCEFPQMDISATFIRECAKNGISFRYLVPEPVREYIESMYLYKEKGAQ